MKKLGVFALMLAVLFSLSGCSAVGDKNMTVVLVYGVATVLSCLLLAGYLCMVRRKDIWRLLLMGAIVVVNTGYWALSMSETLEGALWTNRLAYLGSVLLPFSMMMIVLNVLSVRYKKRLVFLLLGISSAVFLAAASPGYLDIYYAEVTLERINGVTVLNKVYGPWHSLYLFYLLAYFGATVGIVAEFGFRRKTGSTLHAMILAAAVLVNIGVWLLGQLVRFEFEMLSVSYIISELFLLGLDLVMQEQKKTEEATMPESAPRCAESCSATDPESGTENRSNAEQRVYFEAHLPALTAAERNVYDLYLAGKTSREIMETLSIKENTLKYHNRNIYSKLGVSSRKQMLALAAEVKLTAEEKSIADQ